VAVPGKRIQSNIDFVVDSQMPQVHRRRFVDDHAGRINLALLELSNQAVLINSLPREKWISYPLCEK
jgi:hypothetical protein